VTFEDSRTNSELDEQVRNNGRCGVCGCVMAFDAATSEVWCPAQDLEHPERNVRDRVTTRSITAQ
jgi:hypothetical protein